MKKTDTITVLATITDDDIKSAVGVLIDNGVDADDAVDVLQASGEWTPRRVCALLLRQPDVLDEYGEDDEDGTVEE